jgi:predicted Zn-dependent protease
VQQAQERKQQLDDLNITEEEEIKLGADVSAKIRTRFGVAQDAAVHKYVTLVGTTLTDQSTRAKLPWTFIVLDTDGVNAFAAPGGFVHITRGRSRSSSPKPSWPACWDTRLRTSRRSTL